MNLARVSELMGGKFKLSKELGVSPSLITSWGKEVPKHHRKDVKKLLRKRKRYLDKAFGEVL